MSWWTEINWTNAAFNTWIGCHKKSEACANCYALHQSDVLGRIKIWSKGRYLKVWGQDAPRHFQSDDYWAQPLKWNRRAKEAGVAIKVFSNDMSDLFEDYSDYPNGVPGVHEEMNRARVRLWKLIEETPFLEWQLLTKRPENVRRMVPWGATWPRNVWVGTTVETQERALERIPHLIELPAVVRFLSIEPMLGPIDLSEWKGLIDWVINGTESITAKRPVEIDWIRYLRDQCLRDGVAYWFKQWGMHEPASPIGDTIRTQVPSIDGKVRFKKFAVLDGRVWNQFPIYRWKREGKAKTAWERLDAYDLEEASARSEAQDATHAIVDAGAR